MKIGKALLCLISSSVLLFSVLVSASVESDIEQYQGQLDGLEASEVPADRSRRLILQKIVTALKSQLQLNERILTLKQELDKQPDTLLTLEESLQVAPHEPELPDAKVSDTALENLITVTNTRLLELKSDQAKFKQTETQAALNLANIREQLSELKGISENILRENFPANNDLSEPFQAALFTEKNLKIQSFELALLVLPKRIEIAKLNWQRLEEERLLKSRYLESLLSIKQSRQRKRAEETLQELDRENAPQKAEPALSLEEQKNKQLSDALRKILKQIEESDLERRALQDRLSLLTHSFSTISQQLELNVSHITPDQIQFILANREPIDPDQLEKDIALLQLAENQLEQSRNSLLATVREGDEVADETLTQGLRAIQSNRIKLLDQSIDAHSQLVASLTQVLQLQRQINLKIEANRELISQHLLWNPVTREVDLAWPKSLYLSAVELAQHWYERSPESIIKPHGNLYLRLSILGVAVMLCLWVRVYLLHHQKLWANQIGNVVTDRFHHTLQLFLLMPLASLGIPLLIWVVGKSILNPDHPDAVQLAAILRVTGLSTWIVLVLRGWLQRPDGMFCSHFGLNEQLALGFRRRLTWIYLVGLPLLIFQIYLWEIDSEEMRSGLVRLTVISLLLVVGFILASLLRHRHQWKAADRWWVKTQAWVFSLLVFCLLMLLLAGMGYLFTVNFLIYALFQLLGLILLAYIFYKMGMRLVLISKRRLEFDRAKERRAEILAARENHDEEPSPLETNYLNLRTISDHSKTLLKTATIVVFVSMMWSLMGGYFTFFGALDNVELWSTISTDGTTLQITLKSVVFGIAILALCLVGAHNLPGLLQLLVLRNLNLSPGTGYAVSSLIKYALILFGIFSAFSSFGLEWGKLQWLVAALGVGLGFGLQEIVANFVSGLIILFEKPVRIGDTVTIDNLTGTVTRIQIRATTIVDWDRKEVIIPNKTFITQQLINWSLTDSITRIVIPVGVAYGSDTERAKSLMLQAAMEEERVLKEPKPEVFFTAFGDSALNLELRLYVNAMSDRLEMTHRVNTAIDMKFKEAGIEIAFPQLDVHLKRS